MEGDATLRDEFLTLREEIRSTKARLFRLLVLGLVGVPLLAFLASRAEVFHVWLLLPYSVLLLIVVFLSEQNSMMRAGRYIRENIENGNAGAPRWESWIESQPKFRLADRHYVACFLIVFFLYYFLMVGIVIKLILDKERTDMTGGPTYWYWFYSALVTYAIGAIWAIATLFNHWKTTVSTSPQSGK
ncbi:MAG: hypothetical protein H6817_04730 [Phycisphaerales bacterium]|nr:hypothetical protein [Phycisphaerales bacterium]